MKMSIFISGTLATSLSLCGELGAPDTGTCYPNFRLNRSRLVGQEDETTVAATLNIKHHISLVLFLQYLTRMAATRYLKFGKKSNQIHLQ